MSDKEMEVIQGLIDLINGLQSSLASLTSSAQMLKERVEALEAKS